MEGLIPLVCKTLQKNQTRRRYKCLSSSSASTSAAAKTYNISDFYPQGFSCQYPTPQMEIKTSVAANGGGRAQSISNAQNHHRRHNSSMADYSSGFSAAEDMAIVKPNQLVRFRSHKFFSCVTGGA